MTTARPAEQEQADEASRLDVDEIWARLRPLIRYVRHPLAIVPFGLALFGVIGALYYVAARDFDTVQQQVREYRDILDQGKPDLPELRLTLEGWEWSRNLALQNRVTRRFDSELLAELLEIANFSGVEVFSSGVRDESITSIKDAGYRSTPVFVKAHGDLANIEKFLFLLESGALVTSQINSASVSESSDEFVIDVQLNSLSEFPSPVGDEGAADQSTGDIVAGAQ